MIEFPDDVWERLGMEPPPPPPPPKPKTYALPSEAGRSTKMRRSKRKYIYRRDRFRCRDCGEQFVEPDDWDGRDVPGLTLGHIVPKSWGGTTARTNLITQCVLCNDDLGDEVWTHPRYPEGRPQ